MLENRDSLNKFISFKLLNISNCKINILYTSNNDLNDYKRLRNINFTNDKKKNQIAFAYLEYVDVHTVDLVITYVDRMIAEKYHQLYPHKKLVKEIICCEKQEV